jgi:hypothetical protein
LKNDEDVKKLYSEKNFDFNIFVTKKTGKQKEKNSENEIDLCY